MIPKVSIAVPAYNCGRYIGQSLESLLGQTYGDFELVISDNASTDGTESVCREFAARDSRVAGAAREFQIELGRQADLAARAGNLGEKELVQRAPAQFLPGQRLGCLRVRRSGDARAEAERG